MPFLLQPIPWTDVSLDDGFWAPRQKLVRQRTLPALYHHLLSSGRINALRLQWRPGMHPVPHQFWDSDIGKWLEAASYSLAAHPDPTLAGRVDETIELLRSAQQPDGYLNSYVTSVNPEARWTDLRDGHELYCAGHLIEAGVAHHLATGSRALLDVVMRYADYIGAVFGTGAGQKRGYCGHPEIELALVRLFSATGERRYLELSQYFVDERGREPYYFDLEAVGRTSPRASDSYYRRHGIRGMELRRYNQSHLPVREQTEVVGHAVRAMYLFSAMADLAGETDDQALFSACERLWSHLTSKRLYVTGGIGSSAANEGFSSDYDLPNQQSYAETCAAIGLVLWAHRMLQLTGDGRYGDVIEQVLYNAIAAGIGADGEHFFYSDPLASDGSVHRQPWFDVACCPPNVARLLGSLGEYVYSVGEHTLAIHLFARGTARLSVDNHRVLLRQDHDYPWEGQLHFTLELEAPRAFALRVRIPAWCSAPSLRLNGAPLDLTLQRGYACVERTWCNRDTLQLGLPMPVERVYAHPAVGADAGRVALRRGPVVYCTEQTDNPVVLHALALPRSAPLTTRRLDDLVAISAPTFVADAEDWRTDLYRTTPPNMRAHQLLAVPYAVWDNRGSGQMQVWMRESDAAV